MNVLISLYVTLQSHRVLCDCNVTPMDPEYPCYHTLPYCGLWYLNGNCADHLWSWDCPSSSFYSALSMLWKQMIFFHTVRVILAIINYMGDIFWAIMYNSISHNYNLCQNAKNMQLYVEPQFIPKCKKSLIASSRKISPFTLQWTHLCVLKLGKVNSVGIWNLKGQHVFLRRGLWQWGGWS